MSRVVERDHRSGYDVFHFLVLLMYALTDNIPYVGRKI